MRQETLWQGERREARLQWWKQVLERPSGVNGEEVFDEVLSLRFRLVPEQDGGCGGDGLRGGRSLLT